MSTFERCSHSTLEQWWTLPYSVCRTVSTAPPQIADNVPPNSSPSDRGFPRPHRIVSHKTPAHMHHNNKPGHYSDSVAIDLTTDYLIY